MGKALGHPEYRSPGSFEDVRMRGFRHRADVEFVLKAIADRLKPLEAEIIPLHDAADRVLAQAMVSDLAVPLFDRAAMDGYALRGEETFGANNYNPLEFMVIGESLPARPFGSGLAAGQAVRIMTGAPLPSGADAVLQAEAAREVAGRIQIVESVPPRRNVGHRGEDIQAGSEVLPAGRRLRPQDLGLLASIGKGQVPVVRRPVVSLVVTGNELLPVGSQPEGYRIVDSNSVMIHALVSRDGGIPLATVIVHDSRDSISAALMEAAGDVILVSGGSSVGQEDHAPTIVADLGELLYHGVALRPASPTGMGLIKERPVFLLPGNPVSCLCGYDFFAGPAIRRLGGRSMDWPYSSIRLPLHQKIASAIGRVDYVRVRIRDGQVEPLATSGAAILSSTTRADGFVLVSRDSEGFAAGEEVSVFRYDQL